MKNTQISIILILVFLTQTACNSLSEGKRILTNQRTNSTDEFLIEKKDPLALPPDYKEIPEPGGIAERQDKKKLQKILNTSNQNSPSKKSSSAEKSILEKIR